jgi:hypothetical protein
MPGLLIAGVFIVFAIGIRILCHFLDKDRIKSEIEQRGGSVIEIYWFPFARGWWAEKGERHYRVIFQDNTGRSIQTQCKSSLFTGVYWSGEENVIFSLPNDAARTQSCHQCSHPLQSDWSFCPKCGNKIR